MTVTLVGSSWNWNDSAHLQIAQPTGVQAGDLIMAVLGNQADSNVGAGFVQDAGMPAVTDLTIASYPHPGNGGTFQWKYWTYAITDPDPYGWTCAAILDLGVVFALRSDGAAITYDADVRAYTANSTTSTTGSLTGVANRFAVGAWYTQSGGITTDWIVDPTMDLIRTAVDGGTLRQTMTVGISNAPVGAYTKTSHLTVQQDSSTQLAQWVGTYKPPATAPLLPVLGVGA